LGVILDSSILITAERKGNNARQMLAAVSSQLGDTEIALSVLTLLELAHGAERADTLERKRIREQFIGELLTVLPVHAITAAIALRTGQIDGANQAKGMRLPLAGIRTWIWSGNPQCPAFPYDSRSVRDAVLSGPVFSLGNSHCEVCGREFLRSTSLQA